MIRYLSLPLVCPNCQRWHYPRIGLLTTSYAWQCQRCGNTNYLAIASISPVDPLTSMINDAMGTAPSPEEQ